MTSRIGQKRLSKKLLASLLFALLILAVLVFWRPILIKSIEYIGKEQRLSISCLDISIDWRLNLNIGKACITFAMGTIELNQANWQTWSKVLTVEQATITHLASTDLTNSERSKVTPNFVLNLPDVIPKISIANLVIDSFTLNQPLHLSLNSSSGNALRIKGDVDAVVKLQQNNLSAKFDWRLSDLTKWLPQAQSLMQDNPWLLEGLTDSKSNIQTRLTFDGKLLNIDSNLAVSSRFELANCPVDADFNGNLFVNLDISNLNLSLDLSQFVNHFTLANCPLVQKYFSADEQPKLSLVFAQPISFDGTQVLVPQLHIVDTHNALRSVQLSELYYKTAGELDFNYSITVNQSINAEQIKAGRIDYKGNGTVSANLAKLNSQKPIKSLDLHIISDSNQLVINNLQANTLEFKKLTSAFTFRHLDASKIQLAGTLQILAARLDDLHVAKASSTYSLKGEQVDDLHMTLDNQIAELRHPKAQLKRVSNQLDLQLKDLVIANFSGNSVLSELTTQDLKFLPIAVSHNGKVNLVDKTVSSQHQIALEQGLRIDLEQQYKTVNLQIERQNIELLNRLLAQIDDKLILKQGSLQADVNLILPINGQPLSAQGLANFQSVSVKYQDYMLNNISYQTPVTFNSAGLQLTASSLNIDSIDAGVIINNIQTKVIAQNNVFRLKQLQGEIFNGEFSLAQLWLDGRDQQLNVNFQDIDLSQLVALQQQPGIKITGRINGDIPLILDKQGIRVEDGWMISPNGGKLTIVDNPSFDSIKQQQSELALLENLDFSQLKSKVRLNPDGWMFFDFALVGNNPVKKQSVNFNYTHQENILTLLKSIRLTKSVEKTIEQKLTQGDKK